MLANAKLAQAPVQRAGIPIRLHTMRVPTFTGFGRSARRCTSNARRPNPQVLRRLGIGEIRGVGHLGRGGVTQSVAKTVDSKGFQ